MSTKIISKTVKTDPAKKVVIKKAILKAKPASRKNVAKKKVEAKPKLIVKKTLAKKIANKASVPKPRIKKMVMKTTAKKTIATKPKAVIMASAKKQVATKPAPRKRLTLEKDYFKLPFEVYYSEGVPVTQTEFKSDITVNAFRDIKMVHEEQGRCWGLSMACSLNNGPELYCCITNSHDEVNPPWLKTIDEESMNFNYGSNLAVKIEDNKIKFVKFTDEERNEDSEEFIEVDNMDYCCSGFFVYHLDQATPDYLILDAKDSRIKVDLDGYILDDGDKKTKKRVFNPDELDNEDFEDYVGRDFFDARCEWIKEVLEENFPKEKNLVFDF